MSGLFETASPVNETAANLGVRDTSDLNLCALFLAARVQQESTDDSAGPNLPVYGETTPIRPTVDGDGVVFSGASPPHVPDSENAARITFGTVVEHVYIRNFTEPLRVRFRPSSKSRGETWHEYAVDEAPVEIPVRTSELWIETQNGNQTTPDIDGVK